MSNTPKEQTAGINRLHITTPTNSDGIGMVENPHVFYPSHAHNNIRWEAFANDHPPLPVIDHLTGNVKVGWTGEVKKVWQYRSWDKDFDWWGHWKDTCETHAKSLFNGDNCTRLVYLTLADEEPAPLNQPLTEGTCPTCKQHTNVYCSNAYHLAKPPTEDKQSGEMVEEAAEKTTVLRYQIPEQGMPKPPTTFEGKYGFPMSDLNFDSPMNFVWTLGAKSNMDNQEKRTLLEVIQMYLEGVNPAVEHSAIKVTSPITHQYWLRLSVAEQALYGDVIRICEDEEWINVHYANAVPVASVEEKESVKGGETVSLEAVIELVGSYPHISLSSTHDLITQIRNLTGRE